MSTGLLPDYLLLKEIISDVEADSSKYFIVTYESWRGGIGQYSDHIRVSSTFSKFLRYVCTVQVIIDSVSTQKIVWYSDMSHREGIVSYVLNPDCIYEHWL